MTSIFFWCRRNFYFRDRRPILMNYNPTVVLTDAGQKGVNRPDQFRRAAQIAWATAKFHMTLRDEHLEPEVFHLKQKPTRNTKLLTKFLPNWRISVKSKVWFENSDKVEPFSF